jgi:hypothetical protein
MVAVADKIKPLELWFTHDSFLGAYYVGASHTQRDVFAVLDEIEFHGIELLCVSLGIKLTEITDD